MRERYRSIRRSSALVALNVFVVACGSSSDPPSSEELKQPETLSSCTAEIDRANGQACAKEGLACDFVLACDDLDQLARCTCANGRFACTDGTGNVAPGASPQCVKNAPASTAPCPATMDDATGATCDTLGRSCFYEGALCPESPLPVHHFDYCQCTGSPSGAMQYVCKQALCNPILEE